MQEFGSCVPDVILSWTPYQDIWTKISFILGNHLQQVQEEKEERAHEDNRVAGLCAGRRTHKRTRGCLVSLHKGYTFLGTYTTRFVNVSLCQTYFHKKVVCDIFCNSEPKYLLISKDISKVTWDKKNVLRWGKTSCFCLKNSLF